MNSSPSSGVFPLCAVGHLRSLSNPSFLITFLSQGHSEHQRRPCKQKPLQRQRAPPGERGPAPPPSPPSWALSPSGALSTVYQSLKRAECSFLSSSSSGRSRMSFSVCRGTGPSGQEGQRQGLPLETLVIPPTHGPHTWQSFQGKSKSFYVLASQLVRPQSRKYRYYFPRSHLSLRSLAHANPSAWPAAPHFPSPLISFSQPHMAL